MSSLDTQALDASIAALQARKTDWARLPIPRKVDYLRRALAGTVRVAERQVAAAALAKGIPAGSALTGEEWLAGPVAQARTMRLLIDSLDQVRGGGAPRLLEGAVRLRPNGRLAVRVFPMSAIDKVTFAGFQAEVWQRDGVTRANLPQKMAGFYRQRSPEGAVALVLGAGNVASIGPLDVVHKLFVEGQVVLLKWNPVNDYLGPFFEEAFADLIRDGFVRTAYGGADVGEYLCGHRGVEEIHITGSDRTHDAICYGVGAAGAEAKSNDAPRIDKRVTSELGNVSPVIVVPGPWSLGDLRFHAENLATQMANNAGFNCNACKVIVLHEGWSLAGAFLDTLRQVLREAPQRQAYYPGAEARYEAFLQAHPSAEALGPRRPGVIPWTLIPGVDPAEGDAPCFRQESFCGITAQTALPGRDVADFLARAVRFCNETLWGTLNAGVLCHPQTEAELGEAFEQAIEALSYGSVAINHWAALSYALGQTAWGAYPGHTWRDIQSGVGFVHNTLLFDEPEKSVVRGPFRIRPKPPWFITHGASDRVARRLLQIEAKPSFLKLPGLLLAALRG